MQSVAGRFAVDESGARWSSRSTPHRCVPVHLLVQALLQGKSVYF